MKTQKNGSGKKFMQVLSPTIYSKLKIQAAKRGVTVQELIRVIVVPDWLNKTQLDTIRRIQISEDTRKGYAGRLKAAEKLHFGNKKRK